MLPSLLLAFSDVLDPRLRRMLLRSLLIAGCVLMALVAVAVSLLDRAALGLFPPLHALIDLTGGLAGLFLAWLVFPVIVTVVLGFFLDEAVAQIERRRYPELPPGRSQPLEQAIFAGLRLAMIGLVANIVALPLYFIPGPNFLVFYGLNGWLLAREYFDLVATRRLDSAQRRGLWQAERFRFVLAGSGIALLFTIPLVNLAAPLIAATFMLHYFERLRRRLNLSSISDLTGPPPQARKLAGSRSVIQPWSEKPVL